MDEITASLDRLMYCVDRVGYSLKLQKTALMGQAIGVVMYLLFMVIFQDYNQLFYAAMSLSLMTVIMFYIVGRGFKYWQKEADKAEVILYGKINQKIESLIKRLQDNG
jgi:hypothetical protein